MGQSRRFDDVPVTSALPLIVDLRRKDRHVRNVPNGEIALLCPITSSARPWGLGHRTHFTSAPAFSSFRQPRLPQRVVHLLDEFGREAVHAIVGISLADREIRPELQELRDFRLGIIQPTEERQRICRVEMAKPESLEIGVPKILQRLLIFAPPPVPFRRPVPPGIGGVGELVEPASRMALSAIAEPSSQSPMKARLIPKPPRYGSFELSDRAF
jgi:hypothetical protein